MSVINQTKDALSSLQTTAETAGGAGGGGLGSLVSGAANAYGAFQMVTGALTQAGGMISSVAALGEESRKANLALDTLSGGNSGAFLTAGRDATKGLVDDLGLAQMATAGLARGAFTTSEQFAQIARDGAVLGSALGTDAATGVNNLQVALEHVGQVRSLQTLGLDVQNVDAAYKKFISEGIDKTTAWRDAVMGAADAMSSKLGPAIDNGPGVAMAKLTTQWENFKASFAERVSMGIDGSLGLLDKILNDPNFSKMIEYQIAGPTSPSAPTEGSIATGAGGSGGVLGNAMKGMFDNTDWSAFFPSNGGAVDGGMAGLPGAGSSTNFTPGQASQSSYYSPQGQAYQNLDIQWDIGNLRHGSDAQDRLNKNTAQMDLFGGNSSTDKAAEAAANAATTLSLKAVSAAREDDTRLIQTRAQAVQDATQKEKDHAAAINSVATAFGLNQNGLYGQVGSTADQGVATARAAELAKDQHMGMGAAATAKDMANFDKSAQAAQDQYALATGAATTASLAFRDAQNELSAKFSAGKINVADYYRELQKLADIAKTGTATVSDFTAALYGGPAQHLAGDNKQTLTKAGGNRGDGNQSMGAGYAGSGTPSAGGAAAPDATDPFAGAKASADKAKTSVDALGNGITTVDTNISNLAGAMPTYAKNIAAGVTPAQSAIDKIVATSKIVNDMWSKMSGTWSVNVNFTAGGNSRAGVQYQ